MAVDLAANVAPVCPRSIDFFLEETLRDVLGNETDAETAVVELLEQLQQLSGTEKRLLEVLYSEDEGRKPLGACMTDTINERMTVDEFFACSGLDEKAKISKGKLAVWLFHDLQANALANVK